MGSLKVIIEDELLKKFKEKAMKKFGYTRGALSIAAREAFKEWLGIRDEKKEFLEAMEKAAGSWKVKSGYSYVRKIRRESEKRLKRLRI